MKIDPHEHQARYERWKRKTAHGIPGLTESDSRTLKRFLNDMETGLNVGRGSRKGPRSPARLNSLHQKLRHIFRAIHNRTGRQSILEVKEDELHRLFADMRSGRLATRKGKPYKSTADFVKIFKTFWHWHMKIQRKRGVDVPDICTDLDMTQSKPAWVYLTESQVRQLCESALPKYRTLILFLYDSGIRAPTELVNVRVRDLSADCTELVIREESSKTFGRRIKLLLSAEALRQHRHDADLHDDDQLFPISPPVVNRYLRRLGARILGDGVSPAGEIYPNLTMYDFRHSSACFWLPRYKQESAMKYRFGWRRSEMIHYYTELLGMRDTIESADVHLAPERTALERRLAMVELEKKVVEDKFDALQVDMRTVLLAVERLSATGSASETEVALSGANEPEPPRVQYSDFRSMVPSTK